MARKERPNVVRWTSSQKAMATRMKIGRLRRDAEPAFLSEE